MEEEEEEEGKNGQLSKCTTVGRPNQGWQGEEKAKTVVQKDQTVKIE